MIMLYLLKTSGFFNLGSMLCKKKFRILAYHRFGSINLSAHSLEREVRYLRKHFSIINLEDYADFLKGKRELLPNSVILTVDDGYQDFYTTAFQILKKYEIPATVFLTTDFIDGRIWLWHDLLNFGLANTSVEAISLNGRSFELNDNSGKSRVKVYLDRICTEVTPAKRDIIINQVLEKLRVSVPERPASEYAPLTWSQISEMSQFGVSYGAHTCTHPVLSKIAPDEAIREIRESKHRIEDMLQKEVVAFCYPNGKENDFNEDTKRMVKDCGFACALSMIYGMNDSRTDRFALRRMADRESFVHFVHDVSGFGELRRSLRRIRMRYI